MLCRGRLYFATHTGLQACLDASGGALLWARRYRNPEMAPTPRLGNRPDATMAPELWHHCPPATSGEFVAFAPRDSYTIDFLRRRPLPDGRLLMDECSRPRQDASAMTTLWVIGGPAERGLDRANWTHEELADHPLKTKGIRTSRSAVQRFCSRIGIRLYRPTYRHDRGDPQKQAKARQEIADPGNGRRPVSSSC